MTNCPNFKVQDYVDIKKNKIDNLPNGVNVSTMTASIIKTELKFDFNNIFNYLPLSSDDVLAVVRNQEEYRSIITMKKKKKKKVEKKKKRQFFNQYSVIIRINEGECENLDNEKKINFKLFVNGSIQMSGIKDLYSVNKALNKLVYVLGKQVGIKHDNKKKIERIKFVENVKDFDSTGFKLNMINSNYKIRVKINRPHLYQLLLKKKINVTYEKAIRACVCVKYVVPVNNKLKKMLIKSFEELFSKNYDRKELLNIVSKWESFEEKIKLAITRLINKSEELEYNIRKKLIHKIDELFRIGREKNLSIFVFQKGNIIITGAASSRYDIMQAFNFINNIILTHIDDLVIEEEDVRERDIKKFHNEVMIENSHKLKKIFPNGVIPKLFTIT
tara:strand:+ start:84 stop:1247 length:1164 start_codon:yes stop_codon:yes gene_type:complete